ncbi:MAG TPA: GNAT family N-acetyltransferase [Gaiellaceae bacterium]|nr:GNAT family N-acetyltransferase [Gaiellaceae bacterium]
MDVRSLADEDRVWVDDFVRHRWGAPTVVSRGRIHRPSDLPGFVAVEGAEKLGLATYSIEGEACEIVTIDSVVERAGVGSGLVEAVAEAARAARCRRLWFVTTNDNLGMLRFSQKRGFALVAVHREALNESRKLKPQIPLVGIEGIPLRDELELELLL